jgi:hypothetical protein
LARKKEEKTRGFGKNFWRHDCSPQTIKIKRKIKTRMGIRSRSEIRRKTGSGSPNLALALNPLPNPNPHLTPSLSMTVGAQAAARIICHTRLTVEKNEMDFPAAVSFNGRHTGGTHHASQAGHPR